MNRKQALIVMIAVLAIAVGGVFVASNIYACGAKTANAQKASATEVQTTEATATTVSAHGCCAGAVKTADAKGSCTKGAMADAKSECPYSHQMKTADLMDGKATLAVLTHCGIDINATSTKDLATELAEGHCGMYSVEQWTDMINAAKSLDAQTVKTVLASAKTEKAACDQKACPISLVAKELADNTPAKKN